MKTYIIYLLTFSLTSSLLAQVGIGTTDIHDSAVLELKSTTKGFLLPRMTRSEKYLIQNPVDGLCVYSTNSCETGALSFYADGKWNNAPKCENDNDDDGIPNNIDIDDDNDGILDVLERSRQTEKFLYTPDPAQTATLDFEWGKNNNTPTSGTLSDFKYSTSPSGTSGTITWTNLRAVRISLDNPVFRITSFKTSNVPATNDYGNFSINIPNPNSSSNPTVDVTSNPLLINDLDNDFKFQVTITTTEGLITDINELQQSITNGNNGTTGISTITDLGSGVFEINIDYIAANTNGVGSDGCDFRLDVIGKYVTNYFVNIIESQTATGDQIQIPVSRDLLTNIDTDSDGIPNQYDLDSDNDGCSDAFEAGSTTEDTVNFNYTGNDVGTNGLANIIETSDLQSAENISAIDTTNAYSFSANCASNLPTPPINIATIPTGNGALSSRYCFDIAESNDLVMGAGSLLQRKFQRADFNQVSVNTQTLKFTSASPVSNLTFYAVDPSGNIISSFTPDADYSANGSLTEATAVIIYKSDISSPDPDNPTTGSALGLQTGGALKPAFYVVYNDQINGGGAEVKQEFSPSIRDGQCSTNQTSQVQSSHFLTSTGEVYSIGVNTSAYLGDGTLINRDTLVQVTLPNPAITLVSGWSASFVIDNTGELYGWGQNASGQVGNGNSGTGMKESSPVNIVFPNGEKAIQITNSNGNTLALTDASKIYGWGNIHAPGSLGSSSSGIFNTPQEAVLPPGVTPISIMNGGSQNFFFGDNGTLYSSGIATSIGRTSTPAYEFKEVIFPNNIMVHTAATTGVGVLAFGVNNKVYAFGLNYYGEQGVGTPGTGVPAVLTPIEVPISGMGIPIQLFKGYYSSFILDDQNKLFATGFNAYGQLGIGSTTQQNTFTEVTLPSGVIPIDVLTFYSTIYVIAQDGKVYSAGNDTAQNLLQRTVDGTHPANEFHLCTSPILTNNTIIPN